MLDADLALLKEAGAAAGEIAQRYFRQSFDIRDKGDGQGPVTAADLEIDRMLKAELRAARPDYGWLSEETEDGIERLDRDRVFVIDPIDGTRAFIDGQTSFSHALAIVEDGEVIAGVVHMPMREETYFAAKGSGAFCNEARLAVHASETPDGADILAGKFNMAPQHWRPNLIPAFTRHFRPSLAYRMALVAAGRFDGMLTLRPTWEWDVAAGCLLVTEAGGTTARQNGAAPRFNTARGQISGLVAGSTALVTGIVNCLAPIEDSTEKPVERSVDSA